MVTRIELVETREDRILRLAAKAEREGVRVLQDPQGRWWATSATAPGRLHALTAISCDCAGFAHHGACKHHSALLVHLGWVVAPETTCETCGGSGLVERHHSRWVGGGRLGYRDEWTTPETCPACSTDDTAA